MSFLNINSFFKCYIKEIKIDFNFEDWKNSNQFAYDLAVEIYRQGINYSENKKYKNVQITRISIDEMLELVCNYFKSINHSFEKFLLNFIQNGEITLIDEETLKKNTIFSKNGKSESITKIVNGKRFCNVVLDHTIYDAFTLVHEFSHYKNLKEFSKCYSMFTEGYAHTFEYSLYKYLLKNDKWKEEANKYYTNLLRCTIERSKRFIIEWQIFNTYLNYNHICNETILQTLEEEESKEYLYVKIKETINDILFKPEEYFYQHTYLFDKNYIFGYLAFPQMKKQLLENPDMFFSEYENLDDGDLPHYWKKYIKMSSLNNWYLNSFK